MTGMTEILRILGVVALAVAEGGLLKECSNGHVRVAAKEVSGRASNAGIAKSPRFCNGRKTSKTLLEKQLLAKHEYKRQLEDFQNREQREDNDKERLEVDQIQ